MSLPYVLVVHGFTGSGPQHWQSWLAGELANHGGLVDMPVFSEPDRPVLAVWLAELRQHLAAAPRDVERVVLTHSCGSTLWLHHAATEVDRALRVDRALVVAPPSREWHHPDVVGFQPAPLDPGGLRRVAPSTRMVAGDDDPFCPAEESKAMAEALGVELDIIPGGGHLNTDAGYGSWPAVLKWVRSSRTPLTPR